MPVMDLIHADHLAPIGTPRCITTPRWQVRWGSLTIAAHAAPGRFQRAAARLLLGIVWIDTEDGR